MIRRTITIPDSMDAQIERAAKDRGLSYSAYMRLLAQDKLEDEQTEDPLFSYKFDGPLDMATTVDEMYKEPSKRKWKAK